MQIHSSNSLEIKVLTLLFIGLVLLFSAVPLAEARGSKGGCEHKSCQMKSGLDSKFFYKAHFLSEHADVLGLTDQQLHEQVINIETVNQLIDQKYEAKKAKEKQAAGALAQLKSKLSDEQYQKMKDLFKALKDDEGHKDH